MTQILIVDDNSEIRGIVREFVQLMGFGATVAASGREALNRLAHGSFDLVITDLAIPDLDGWTLLERVHGEQPDLPVVLMSGWGCNSELALARGAAGWISKPFGFRAVEEAIRPWIAQTENRA